MVTDLNISRPLPRRAAAESLRQQVIDHLVEARPKIGELLTTDMELVRKTNLSRSTVRRALDDLQRDGWIERRNGQGTFVGPRAALRVPARTSAPAMPGQRVSVAVAWMDFDHAHWQVQPLTSSLVAAGAEVGLSIELISLGEGAPDVIARRLLEHDPQVLVSLIAMPNEGFLIGEAQRRGKPVVSLGTRRDRVKIPNVYDDGRRGIADAVERLVAMGHHRIAFLQTDDADPWVFDRLRGFREGMTAAGLEAGSHRVHWLPRLHPASHDADDRRAAEFPVLQRFLERETPSAVICGNYDPARYLGAVAAAMGLAIPDDLSVVVYDQEPTVGELLGRPPTHIRQPLREMSREAARIIRSIVDGEPYELSVAVPPSWCDGQTVKSLDPTSN